MKAHGSKAPDKNPEQEQRKRRAASPRTSGDRTAGPLDRRRHADVLAGRRLTRPVLRARTVRAPARARAEGLILRASQAPAVRAVAGVVACLSEEQGRIAARLPRTA